MYDYHARFYDPSIGRFVLRSTPRHRFAEPQNEGDADTIVPGPGSPQSWDRYAYVNNNPVRYSDPSGRYYEEDGPGRKNNTPIPPPNIIIFSGNGWTADAKNNINNAANIYGGRLLPYAIREMQRFIHMGVYDGPINLKNGAQVFKLIFGELEFVSHTNSCSEYFTSLGVEGASSFDCYGCAAGSQTVFKFTNAAMSMLTSEWAGHEISHIFDLHIGLQGRNSISGWMVTSLDGIASGRGMRQNTTLVNYEIFANMADSWAFNIWDTSDDYADEVLERKSLMDNSMALWVSLAILSNH